MTEVKIVDNQIMNFNNRSDYLQGILNALNGLYYYLNDFNSTGILYYEVGDLYNVKIGENTYQCLMLNDEINVTTGIEEIIHTDMPEKSETDYSKADKTDMRINKTYLIVDKQNQRIDSVVSNVSKQNDKISKITQTVDELSSQISDIADITTYGESDRAEVELTDVNESEPIMIKVHPTSTNISYLYPNNNLLPSDTQCLPDRIIRFTRTYEEDGTTKTENIDYLLPDDLLRYSNTVYDEFYLDYDNQTCQVIKRCAYNADGTVRALGTEITTDYPYPTIALGEGNYTITLLGYDFGYIYARLMAKNIYTTQFYTKAETDSRINQKADEINLGVNQTLTNYSTTNQMNSAINLKANEITSTVSNNYETKNSAQSNYSQLQQTANNISSVVSKKVGNDEIISKINQSSEAVTINANKISLSGKTIKVLGGTQTKPKFSISDTDYETFNNLNGVAILPNRIWMKNGTKTSFWIVANSSGGASLDMPYDGEISLYNYSGGNTININGETGNIKCISLTQTSLAEHKKNFEKMQDNALEIIKNIDIYKYNLKNEKDTDKKHIGFVIGDNYNYSKEVTSIDNQGVDNYSFTSLCCKAIQEQQEEIEQMKKEIEKLKGEK